MNRFREVSVGITPACAGKTQRMHNTHLDLQDHPRMCGENVKWEMAGKYKVGSPPHVRGKLAPQQ